MFFATLFVILSTTCYQTLSLARHLSHEHRASSLTSSTTSRFMPSQKISHTSISDILLSRQESNRTKAPLGTTPLGYTLDPCRDHSDCIGNRLCLADNLQSSCRVRGECLCLGSSVQLCDRNCTECENYPNETCGYLPQDLEADVTPTGVCTSTYTIFEGFIVELGCNSFPDVTPLLSNDDVGL